MRDFQKYSPKYWVYHKVGSDDIIVGTLAKSKNDCMYNMFLLFGSYEWDTDEYECILIEINKVEI